MSHTKAICGIVAGGGWVTKEVMGRPNARRFAGLSFLWLWVSVFASMPFWGGWPESFGAWEWVGAALVVPQVVFPLLAIVFRIAERPRIITVECEGPEDIRNLY